LGKAPNARVGNDAGSGRETVLETCSIEMPQQSSCPDVGLAAFCIDDDLAHRRQVDHQSAVTD
jgi:hypothetical protein